MKPSYARPTELPGGERKTLFTEIFHPQVILTGQIKYIIALVFQRNRSWVEKEINDYGGVRRGGRNVVI
jgi:hypothetical protein